MWNDMGLSPAVARHATVSRYATGRYADADGDAADEDDLEGAPASAFTGDFLRSAPSMVTNTVHSGVKTHRAGPATLTFDDELNTSSTGAWGGGRYFGGPVMPASRGTGNYMSDADGTDADDANRSNWPQGSPVNSGSAYDEDSLDAPFVMTVQRQLIERCAGLLRTTHVSPFDEADALTQVIVEQIDALRRRAPLLPKVKQAEVITEIMQLKRERNTWSLLGTVLRDRQEPFTAVENPPHGPQTDKMTLEQLNWNDKTLRWCAYVVQWLE